jgi:hypothetical protein
MFLEEKYNLGDRAELLKILISVQQMIKKDFERELCHSRNYRMLRSWDFYSQHGLQCQALSTILYFFNLIHPQKFTSLQVVRLPSQYSLR